MQNDIRHSWFFNQSPEQVWEYLTRAELIAQWLMKNNFEPVVGHQFQFNTGPIPSLGLDGIFHCRVLEIVPFSKLAYSWKGGSGNGVTTLDTIVTWTLMPKDHGTALNLIHSGFKEENAAIFTGMYNGWLEKIEKMTSQLNGSEHANASA